MKTSEQASKSLLSVAGSTLSAFWNNFLDVFRQRWQYLKIVGCRHRLGIPQFGAV
ncbi:hypothetical protein H6F73_05225 [Microcoleus sp. FACHB-68]|nr:hypothetical protein [Microcoleus sp. FACHB-68]